MNICMRDVLVGHTRRRAAILRHQRTRRANRLQVGDGGDVKETNGVADGHVITLHLSELLEILL